MSPARRTRSHPARLVLACVLIGLLLNAVVTVACWLAQPTRWYRQTPPVTVGTPGPGKFVSSTMAIHYLMHSLEMHTAGRSLPRSGTQGWQHATTTSNWQYIYQFGFPFRNIQHRNAREQVHSHHHLSPSIDTSDSLPLWQRGLPTGLTPFQYQRFPIQPVFPGIVLNTVIYTAIAMPAFMIFMRLLARSRRRRGRCSACAYDLTDLTTCPECRLPILEPTERSRPR